MITRFLIILTGYLFGLFQTGWFWGEHKKINLKQHGSGNTGATNALRVMGLKAGLIVLAGDAIKGFIPVIFVRLLFKNQSTDVLNAYILYAGLGAVLGNNYPFFLDFNGGKGVAVSLGWLIAWKTECALICLIIFTLLAFLTRYVSIASISCCLSVIAMTHIFAKYNFGIIQNMTSAGKEFVVLGFLIPLLVIVRHYDNIKRLIEGKENRFGKK